MKKNGLFIVTSLMAFIFWQWSYNAFQNHFSGLKDAEHKIHKLQVRLHRSTMKTSIVQYKFDLFKQQVAMALPQLPFSKDIVMQSAKRGIASLVQSPPEDFLPLAQVESSIEDMTKLFEDKKYKEVVRKGKNILSLHPMSTNLVNVYFMMSESYYQLNEIDYCMEMARVMTEQFPEFEKTGWVLLRVGLFLKEKARVEEAENMFSLVAHAFSDEKALVQQANKLRESLGVNQ